MSFEIFWPAAVAAIGYFVFAVALLFWLIRRTSERVWIVLISAFVSVMIYVFFTGIVFAEHAVDYMPSYLYKLFM